MQKATVFTTPKWRTLTEKVRQALDGIIQSGFSHLSGLPASSSITPHLLERAFNHLVRDSLYPAVAGLAILYGLLGVSQVIRAWNEPAGTIEAGMLLGTAVLFFAIYLFLHARTLPLQWAHPMGLFIAAVALLNSLARPFLMTGPPEAPSMLFVVVGIGLLFLSLRWFIAGVGLSLLAWIGIATWLPLSPNWFYFGANLIISTLLSTLAFTIRRRALVRYEILRLQEKRSKEELHHRMQQLEISMAVGKHVTSILDLDILLVQVAELIKERFGYYYVGVFLLDGNGEYVRARAGTGVAGRMLCQQNFRLRVGQEGLIGWVAAQGRPLRVDDVVQDERYFSVSAVPNTRSELDLPLQMGPHLLGVLNLQSETLATFVEDDVPFLQLLADQVAIAIHNASLYHSEQTARRAAETMSQTGGTLTSTLHWGKVLDLILGHLELLVPHDRASILARQGEQLAVVAAHGFPPESEPLQIRIALDAGESIFREIYRTQRPLAIPDVVRRSDWQQMENLPQARAWLGVPLIYGGEVVGMLSLTRETAAHYRDEEVALALTFAGHAAIALRNATLYDKLSRFNQQLEYEVHQRTEALQEAYDRLERLDRTKSDFINITSHELRTPLTVLKGYSQMLLKDKIIQENERHTRLLSGILAGSERMEEIVNSMLDMVKIDSRALELYPEPLSVAALIQLIVSKQQKILLERKLTFALEEMDDMPPIEADPDALQKVFRHLIINAIKYTPDGGTITISGGPLARKGLDLPEEGVEIVVSDTGIGVDPEVQDLIFTKFYQTGRVALHSSGKTAFKAGGPGLGLAIARGIVEAHRGKLWVESRGYDENQNPGSQFHVILPLRQN